MPKQTKQPKLSKKDLKEFKKLLEKTRDENRRELRRIEENLKKSPREATGDLSGYTIHLADLGTDTNETEKLLLLREREEKYFYKLEDALLRVEKGDYGICERCKKIISKKRLKAVPSASHCVKCKEEKNNYLL